MKHRDPEERLKLLMSGYALKLLLPLGELKINMKYLLKKGQKKNNPLTVPQCCGIKHINSTVQFVHFN